MMAVFIFHSTRFFNAEGWHLKTIDQSEPLFIAVRALVWPWVMELFFILSGVGTWYALQSRRAGDDLWERTKRLLVPLHTGARYLTYNHKILAYANEAVLPFYLFPQTVILVVGFFVVRWNLGILPKVLIVAAVSFPLAVGFYEFLVGRLKVRQFLFGMRPKDQGAASPGGFSHPSFAAETQALSGKNR